MKRKIIIHPDYIFLDEFIQVLPEFFENNGHVIQNRRNVIKVIEYKGLSLNIKQFRKPIFINRIVYTFFRKPKAYRAYYNALSIIDKGFETPFPIAYIEERKSGLISSSYFISIQLREAKEIREYYHTKVSSDEKLLTAFSQYSALLHEANILHLDYSPGNILISEKGGKYSFSLIDINRMKFCKVGINDGCKNFQRLFEHDEAFEFIAKEYARTRNLDEKQCTDLMLMYKKDFKNKKKRKIRLKKALHLNKKK